MRPRRRRGGTLARPVESGVSVQHEAALAVDARMTSEAVLYTTVAAVHRHRQDHVLTEPDALVVPAAVLEAGRSRRIQPPCTWQPISYGAWAQVHICVEIDPQTSEACFRIVVWLLESGTVIVNDILGAGCRWWRSACDDAAFRRLSGVDCHTYGFHFRSVAKATECSRIVNHILANVPGVLKVVKKLMRANIDLQGLVMAWQGLGLHSIHYPARIPRIYSETTPSSSSSPRIADLSPDRTIYPKKGEASSLPREAQQQHQEEELASSDYDRAVLEDLKTCKAAAGLENLSSGMREEHSNHVDEEFGRMATSPVALLETAGGFNLDPPFPVAKRSRGEWISRPYKMREETHVTYNAEFARFEGLPDEWRELNQQFGLPLEVVLKRERTMGHGQKSINDGTFTDCADVHIMASLIKVWFRELPVSLFNMLPDDQIARTCELVDPEPKVVLESLAALPALHQSVVLWLLDLLNEVVKFEHQNKMTAKSMAIVMAPNLLSVKNADAGVVVAAYRQVADFMQILLRARQAQRSGEMTHTIRS
ncbi:Rho GTPase-activating protein gacA [Phytophthora cinnamomi]|uniref:Rho GTPase-activating protein gacA n=1 Tax=Phytophthora cinnamomi TaxID=4785 RepID=UPI00355A4860|nr:Rho GTPase-activating protein gacA [Phytophthora cinnamomi]